MTAHYKSQGKNVFEYLPVTFHIKARNDSAWAAFTTYFETDRSKGLEGQRLWIVKPGENTNRGSGITIHTSYDRIKELVYDGLDGTKTFIVQKYIDHPFLYNRRKFDIRCYMMLSRLNGQIKGYWYD